VERKKEFVIREASPTEWDNILPLYTACYGTVSLSEGGRVPSRKDWEWCYLNGPYKTKIFVAEDKDTGSIVALRPIVFKEMRVGDKYIKASHFMGVMTHPDFRRRGLFTLLMKRAMKEVMEQDVSICYTFPNENSFPAYKKVTDWVHLASMDWFVRIVNIQKILEAKLAKGLIRYLCKMGFTIANRIFSLGLQKTKLSLKDFSVERITHFDESFNKLCDKALEGQMVILKKDHTYLNWRYIERPDIKYVCYAIKSKDSPLGIIVVRTRNMFGLNLGLIVELIAYSHNEEVIHTLINIGTQELLSKGVDAILCLLLGKHPFSKGLLKNGFFHLPKWVLPRDFPFLIRVNEPALNRKIIYNPSQWFVTFGDNDAV